MVEDSRVSRRACLLAPLLLALIFGAQPAGAASSPGARLAVVALKAPERTALFTVDALGAERRTLYAAAAKRVPAVYPFSPPSWSPDGARVAFTAIVGQVKGKYVSFPRTMLALAPASGGSVESVAGTAGGFGAVFSPDGRRIAFARARNRWRQNDKGGVDQVYGSVSIWLADLARGVSTRLTPWRNGLYQTPSSFTPDGSHLALTRFAGGKPPEAVAMELDGSGSTVLAHDALEPVYSPDGRQIAFIRGPMKKITRRGGTQNSSAASVSRARLTDIYVRSDLGGLLRLTKTSRKAESTPRWDPSGRRLVYTELKPFASEAAAFGFGDAVREINADGTCPTGILAERQLVLYAATWQPGPGREAGPISC